MVGEIETRPSRLPFAKRVGNGFFKTALLAAGECFFMDGAARVHTGFFPGGAGMPGSDPSTPHAFPEKRRGHWKGAF